MGDDIHDEKPMTKLESNHNSILIGMQGKLRLRGRDLGFIEQFALKTLQQLGKAFDALGLGGSPLGSRVRQAMLGRTNQMHVSLLAASDLLYVWGEATIEGKAVIITLILFSIFAWTVMASKAMQMRRARTLNRFFETEFRTQKQVLEVYDRRVQVPDCPLFVVYQEGCRELDKRLKDPMDESRRRFVSLKAMEHVKRTMENMVAQQCLNLESGLIVLALAVSGAPFLGLLGTVWGVMSTFGHVGMLGKADLATMAPGVAAALLTTVAGLLVAIPSMFGYNWLVHNLRAVTVQMDNFAQELVSKMETEFLKDE
jgi:biopolymer transport protein ExbB/TolQ